MDKKCAACGSVNLEEGIIRSSDAMPVIFITKENDKKFFNNKHKGNESRTRYALKSIIFHLVLPHHL